MEQKGLTCVVCQERVGIIDAEYRVCTPCSKKRIKGVSQPAFEIMRKSYSLNPGDSHLDVVLAVWGTHGEYVTWIHNKSVGGYGEGHYFMDLDDAREDFYKRGNLPLEDFSVCVFLNVKTYSPRDAEKLVREAINAFNTSVDVITMAVGQKVEGSE